jgi:hypothetical protein
MQKTKQNHVKALSVAQPWADCIVKRGKNIENRSWSTQFRGYFAVHASGSCDLERFERCEEVYGIKIDPDKVAYGAIIGFAKLSDVVVKKTLTRDTKKWFMGEFGFVLTNIIRLKTPVPVKGSLSFWTLDGPALKKVMSQLSVSQRSKIFSDGLKKDLSAKAQAGPRKKRAKTITIDGLKIHVAPGFKGFE